MSVPTTEAEIAAVFAPMAKFSLGCMFAQVVVDTFFAGILTMQVYTYFKYQRHEDSWWTKGLVIFATALNAGITVYLWYFIQYLFVANFGLWSPFAETRWLAPFPFLDSLNSGVIQAFFCHRAWRLCGRNWLIPAIVAPLILASIGSTLSVWVLFTRFGSLFLAAGVSVPELIWLSTIMSADIIITCSILFGLLRSKTGWSHTDKIITRLVRMTLESQVPPTFVAITFMIEFVRTPSSLFGSTMQGIQPKIYVLGLMYALNARIQFKREPSGTRHDETVGPVFAMSNRPTQKTIQVDTETIVQSETFERPDNKGRIRRNPYDDDDKLADLEEAASLPEQASGYHSTAHLNASNHV